MWPFDKILLNRIKDLERSLEIITGANQVLSSELEITRNERSDLLEKIFNLTGVNSTTNQIEQTETKQPIKFGKKSTSWPSLKENLELKAREDYWTNKNKEKEKEKTKELDKLEKDVLGAEAGYAIPPRID